MTRVDTKIAAIVTFVDFIKHCAVGTAAAIEYCNSCCTNKAISGSASLSSLLTCVDIGSREIVVLAMELTWGAYYSVRKYNTCITNRS